jgi:hypothetical protein
MTRVTNQPAAGGIHQATEAVLAHYQSAPAVETERAIAVLALWALNRHACPLGAGCHRGGLALTLGC